MKNLENVQKQIQYAFDICKTLKKTQDEIESEIKVIINEYVTVPEGWMLCLHTHYENIVFSIFRRGDTDVTAHYEFMKGHINLKHTQSMTTVEAYILLNVPELFVSDAQIKKAA